MLRAVWVPTLSLEVEDLVEDWGREEEGLEGRGRIKYFCRSSPGMLCLSGARKFAVG